MQKTKLSITRTKNKGKITKAFSCDKRPHTDVTLFVNSKDETIINAFYCLKMINDLIEMTFFSSLYTIVHMNLNFI